MKRLLAFIGCSLLGLAAGFAAAMATRLSVPSASAGDWLAFSGALAGVMLTIGATLAIEAYSRSWRYRDSLRRLTDVVQKVARAASEVRYEAPRKFESASAWYDAGRYSHSLLNALAQYKFVRDQVFVEDVNLWSQLRHLDIAIGEANPVFERHLEMLAEQPRSISESTENYLADLVSYRKETSRAAAAIQSSAHDLRKMLKRAV